MNQATNTESGIRIFSLIRRLGSVLTVFIVFLLFSISTYHNINDKYFLLPTLKEIHKNGITTKPIVENEYEINGNYVLQLKFKYTFKTDKGEYKDTYSLNKNLPSDSEELNDIFTVTYLEENPAKNSLNIKDEIITVEKRVKDSSIFWFLIKIIGSFITGLILLSQIISLLQEIKDINKPIETPEYLK